MKAKRITGFNFMYLKFSRKHFEIPRVLPGACTCLSSTSPAYAQATE